MDLITSTPKQSTPLFNHIVERHYRPGYDRLRLILMFFMCIKLSDAASTVGSFAQTISGFSTVAFYILSGYLVLRKSHHRPERILRTIKRSAIVFAVLAVFYFTVNIFYYRHIGADLVSDLAGGRVWFDFFVLNLWPLKIGSAIWYVQAYLYAYIIIYFLEKWELLRFDWLIAAVLIVFTVVTGELCGVIRWNILGHTYLPGCFLTRALPYILLGACLRRKIRRIGKTSKAKCWIGIAIGVGLMLLEIFQLAALKRLGYYGHLIGMPVVALFAMLLTVEKADHSGFEKRVKMTRCDINCIYYLFQPVYLLLTLLIGRSNGVVGIVALLACFGAVLLLSLIERKLRKVNHGKNKN